MHGRYAGFAKWSIRGQAAQLQGKASKPAVEIYAERRMRPRMSSDEALRQALENLRGLTPATWYGTIAENLQAWRLLLADERFADPRRLERHGAKSYSQNDEDGILAEIFRRLGIEVATFIEFGVGNGLENNTVLWLKSGATGLWIEGDPNSAAAIQSKFAQQIASGQLRFRQSIITTSNIDSEFVSAGMIGDIDLLSVDIDGNDYYVFDAIRSISPKVVVIEYNAKYPPPIRFRIPYTPEHRWDGTDWFGASLQSLEELFAARGYGLVGCNLTGANAFFVRNDLINEQRFHPPFSAANHYQPARYYLTFGLFQHIGGHPADPRPGVSS